MDVSEGEGGGAWDETSAIGVLWSGSGAKFRDGVDH
jgi:hypothetical protein